MATDDEVEVMVDELLSSGLRRVVLARNLVTFTRQLASAIVGLTVLGAVIAVVAGFSADTNGGELIGLGLYTLLAGFVLVALLLGLATLIDLSAARLELALWQSPLFEEEESE
jgi:cation transporter-like permease